MIRTLSKLGLLFVVAVGAYITYPCAQFISIALGKPFNDTFKNVTVISNHDGDTFTVNLSNLPAVFGVEIPVRIAGIDAAEIDSKNFCEKTSAVLAKNKLGSILRAAKTVDLLNVRRDKYFRLLADVTVESNLNLAEYLISFKLAVPYNGGTKTVTDWCQYPPNKN